ncbi:MAG: HD domain-containing protein [Crocinitomicaceae bacterium]
MDFKGIRTYILDFLANELDERLTYHSLKHTLDVETAVERYAELESVPELETTLLKTGALFHDCGYIFQYTGNEQQSVKHFKSVAHKYNYSEVEILFVERIIMATASANSPNDIHEKIICDSDHDYLGSDSYHHVAGLLRAELKMFGYDMSDLEWLRKQINYLENHHKYYTDSAINMRLDGKKRNLEEIKTTLKSFNLKE